MTSTAPKRSLFSKPSWASTTAQVPKSGDNVIFGRSQIYEDIIAEKKKRKDRQAAKARAREQSEGRESKRQRISSENEDGSDSDVNSATSEESQKENVARDGPVTRSTPTKQKFAAALDSPVKPGLSRSRQPEATTILLDDEDDEVQITDTTTARGTNTESKTKPVDELDTDLESDEEDEYLRDLKGRAREKAILQKQSDTTKVSPAVPSLSMTAEMVELPQDSPAAGEIATPKDEGPTVRILIDSIYPKTNALIVNLQASRPLKRVREIWCAKQGFSDEKAKTFFLTWNGTKLFDSSNLMNTLEVLKRQRPEEEDPSGGRIHLEMMNAQIMEHRRMQKERQDAEEAGPADQDEKHEAACY